MSSDSTCGESSQKQRGEQSQPEAGVKEEGMESTAQGWPIPALPKE